MSKQLLASTATVGAMTMISRVLGLVRDMVFANVFSLGAATDAFFVAFKIPNFLRRLFAEGAFSQAFVPVLAEYRSQRDQAEVRRLVAGVSGTLSAVLVLLSAFAIAGAPLLVMVFAPGFIDEPAKFDLTAHMLRITFPYLFFISLTALAAGVLNTYGQFAVPAFTPVFLNIVLIGSALYVAPGMQQPVVALAWGVFVAGVVQLAFQLPFLARLGLLPRPRWGWAQAGVRRISRLMLPAIFGSSVVQINLLFDTLIASFLVSGSVSWLYFSDRLVEFPLGVFGIALATVILPKLSQQHAEATPEAFSRTVDWALRWVTLIALPAMVGLLVLSGPILATLFQYGEFEAHDVRMASLSLMAYAVGLPGFVLVKVLAPGFFARQDTRTPVRIAVIAMLVNMALNVAFVVPLVMLGFSGPHAGLALATSLAAFVNAGLLLRGLRAAEAYRPQPGWSAYLLRVAGASAAMGALLWWGAADLDPWLQWDWLMRTVWLGAWIAAGLGTYLALLTLSGLGPRAWLPRR